MPYYPPGGGVGGAAGAEALFVDFADAGNVGVGETDLYSHTLAAGQLAANGDSLDIECDGLVSFSNAQDLTFKLYFGGTAIFTFGPGGPDTVEGFRFRAKIVRVSSSVIRWDATFVITNTNADTGFTGNHVTEKSETGALTGLTLANTQVVKITGQIPTTGTDNLIVAKSAVIRYFPAP